MKLSKKLLQMTLAQEIKSEPYLKANNCTDISDVDYAIKYCKKLLLKHGDKPSLCQMLYRLTKKKEELEAKTSTSSMHPIFKQALAPFGIK